MAANVSSPFIRVATSAIVLISSLAINSTFAISPVRAATNNLNVSVTDSKVVFDATTNNYAVSIAGEIANDSNSDLSEVSITLGTKSKLTSRDALHTFLADRIKAKLTSTLQITKVSNLKANSMQSWQLTFNAQDYFPNPNGVFGFGVTATSAKSSSIDVFALTLSPAPVTKLNTVIAVPLTTLNAHSANGGVTANDDQELKRLLKILTSAKDLEISWIVDPALISWLTDLQKTDLNDQASELIGLLDAVRSRTTYSLYGQPDVARMISSNLIDDLVSIVSRTKAVANNAPVIYQPKNYQTSNAAINKLGELGVLPLLTNEAVSGKANKSLNALTKLKDSKTIIADSGLFSCIDIEKQNAITKFRDSNCLQNDLSFIAAEQFTTSVLVAPVDWSPSDQVLPAIAASISGSSNTNLYPLSALLLTEASGQQKLPSDIKVTAFDKELLNAGDTLSKSTSKIASLFATTGFADAFTLARLRSYSSLWPTGDLATEFLKSNEQLLISYQNSVAIDASRNITVSNSSTQVPVTVVNNSDHDVSIILQLSSPMTSRFTSEPSAVVLVPSGKRVTVPMAITLTGEGILNVTATLTTPDGQSIGKPKLIQISSAEYQGFARTLVLVAFGLLILLSISNLVKRKRESN